MKLIGQFLVLLLSVGYIHYFYLTNVLPDKEAKLSFQQTQCFLINKKLSTKGHLIKRYRADFLVSYNVEGIQYNRWVSGNGLDNSFMRNKTNQVEILSKFDVGNLYICQYHPNSPHLVLLINRKNWVSIFPLIIPSIISMIVFYYFLKNLFLLIDILILKPYKKHSE